MRIIVALSLLAGCSAETGMVLEASGPDGVTSVTAGISWLEFYAARPSGCGRWVEDGATTHTTARVRGRDLDREPYNLLVKPAAKANLAEPVLFVGVARSEDRQLLGDAAFGALNFRLHQVLRRQARIELHARATASPSDRPKYAADDGCLCLPGRPWLASGSGQGCDLGVPPSYDRLSDPACQLAGYQPPIEPVCDGQLYPGELRNRRLPCFTRGSSNRCLVQPLRCQDSDGIAYADACQAQGDGVPADASLCDAFSSCEQTACSDVIGCFKRSFPRGPAFTCTLRIDDSTARGAPLRPCPGGEWRAPLGGGTGDCLSVILDGVGQPPFTLGFADGNGSDPLLIAATCPPTLLVTRIAAASPAEAPATFDFQAVLANHVVSVHMVIVSGGCGVGSSLACAPSG